MTGILALPIEVRLQIYQELVIYDRPYEDHPWGGHLLASWAYRFYPAILGVNRQINQEAMEIFYGMNQLRFYINLRAPRRRNVEASSRTLKGFQNSLCFHFIQYLSFDMYLSCNMRRTYITCPKELLRNIKRAQARFDQICLVLTGAPKLRDVEIAWNDDLPFGDFDPKRLLLHPLGRLPTTCTFKVDQIEIDFLDSPTHETFFDYLQEITGVLPTWKTTNYWNDPSCPLARAIPDY